MKNSLLEQIYVLRAHFEIKLSQSVYHFRRQNMTQTINNPNSQFISNVCGSNKNVIVLQCADGLNECEQVLNAHGSVSALCIDKINGAIICGTLDTIRYITLY